MTTLSICGFHRLPRVRPCARLAHHFAYGFPYAAAYSSFVTHSGGKLSEIGQDLYAWLPPRRGWGLANCGLLVSPRGALWIDTPYDRRLAREFLAQSSALLPPGVAVDRVVVTHANGDHFWGAGVVPDAEVIATAGAHHHMHFEPGPGELDALLRTVDPASVWGAYAREHFGPFDWSGTEPVTLDTAFEGDLELMVGDWPVRLASLPPGHTVGDLFVHLPAQKAVFTGDAVFGTSPAQPGDHPVHWAGPLANLIASCRRFLATGAETFVPGHGPVLDRAGIAEHIAYLEYVQERAHTLHASGVPVAEAARRVVAEGRYPQLGLPERLLVTIGSEYRGLDGGAPVGIVETMQELAQLAVELNPSAS